MLPVAILAGGLATRLWPATETIPKALIEINGEPFAAHQLRLLRKNGIDHVVFCVGYRGTQIQEYVGDGSQYGMRVEYSSDGPQLLGTAGALRNALPYLGDKFLVIYGDSFLPSDYAAVEKTFLDSGKLGLMTVCANEGKWDTSNVEFADGRILVYDKAARTPRMQHIDYGLGAFHSSAFAGLPQTPSDLASVYQDLLRQGELAAYEVEGRFYEIGSFQGIKDLESYLRQSNPTDASR